MPHHTPLISTIVAALVLAFILGAIANRFRVSPLVGYLLAGVLIGPFTPGYVADQGIANDLAEIGVILLMFGVGLHFTLDDLLSVKATAVPGALVQVASATDGEVLQAANLPGARCLIVAIPDAFEGGQVVAQARAINPALHIIARSHSDEETEHLKKHGASRVIMGEHEIAMAMLDDRQTNTD